MIKGYIEQIHFWTYKKGDDNFYNFKYTNILYLHFTIFQWKPILLTHFPEELDISNMTVKMLMLSVLVIECYTWLVEIQFMNNEAESIK